MARCTSKTRAGKRCKNNAQPGTKSCKQHSGEADVGRPSKLTAEVQAKICQALAAGNYQEVAARFAGISEATFYAWIERGEADVEAGVASPHSEFLEAVSRARADAEVAAVGAISRAMRGFNTPGGFQPGDWRAAAHFLERSMPDRWGRRDSVDLGGSIGIRSYSDIAKRAQEFIEQEGGD